MTLTETGVHRRQVLAAMAVPLAGCSGQVPGADTEGTRTDAGTPTDTAQSEPGGWSVRFAYDGDWQGTVSVTTAEGDSHQAFDGQGAKIVDIETQLGVETQAVEDIVVTAQKRVNDNRSLQVAIRKDGDIVAEGSTAQPRGQVMVSHHEEADADTEGTRTDTETSMDTPPPEPGGWSVHFAYDGNWQGTVTVTTAEGDSHQAFDGQGAKIVDIETQLGVETRAVEEIVVTAQKQASDDQTLQVAIRKDGDVVAEGSTAQPRGQVMVSHHEESDTDTEGTRTDTETPTETPQSDSSGWSVRFAYDGDWEGTVTVTTAEGDSHQTFDGQGTKIVDIEAQLGVETRAVEEIVVTAQKQASDDQTLQVAIRKDGDIVAEGSTAQPRGQVMVSHHV